MVLINASTATWTDTDDGNVLVLDLRTSRYLSLNGSAGTLWRALSTGASEDELSDLLVQTYGIDPERAGADVTGFLAELRERDFVSN